MALAAALAWNPLRCRGTALPPNLLLAAKLVAVALLLTGHVRLLPEPFLPFIPALEGLPPEAFRLLLQGVFVASAAALLLNRAVRASAFALGATLLIAVVSSRAYYGNNKTFCGLLLVLIGLYDARVGARLVQWQLVLVYLGAGLNKLLDADWLSGQFFHHWAGTRLRHALYLSMASALPPLAAAKLFGWTTIAVELGVSAAILWRPARAAAMWASVLFQCALLLFTGQTFTLFFYGMQAAMLAFAVWPERVLVIYDGDCGFCTRTKRFFERLDFDGTFEWRTAQSGTGDAFGISRASLRERLYLVESGRAAGGFHAFQKILLWNPLTYFAMTVAIAAAPAGWTGYRRAVVACLLALFFPLFRPAGEALYALIARNRHRLSSAGACDVG